MPEILERGSTPGQTRQATIQGSYRPCAQETGAMVPLVPILGTAALAAILATPQGPVVAWVSAQANFAEIAVGSVEELVGQVPLCRFPFSDHSESLGAQEMTGATLNLQPGLLAPCRVALQRRLFRKSHPNPPKLAAAQLMVRTRLEAIPPLRRGIPNHSCQGATLAFRLVRARQCKGTSTHLQ